ncbi:MAG: protein kinase [Labilithrix sp.]|nr:protein kinase [Labilithrix sp.]MBX3224005.1 protein kinase [Labilithrix sp.]
MDVDCGSARDRLGRTLGGKYQLKSVLGAGGTAVVYRAQTIDGLEFAVKVLHDHLSRSEEVCRRFVREGQLGNVLDHSGTVRVLDHGSTEEGCPYLVLEFLEGESLEERRVRVGGRLELWETLDFCDQLLAVLEIAHAKSIVHRDIKPSNLFVTKAGRLKVLDFGIARLVDDTSATSTKTGQMVGTPAFMPPEQALSRPRDVDARTDIWSVGATLFTLLSGEHVHIAETSSEHLVKAATLHARSLARALPGVPANVESLVAGCLAFDKAERWSSATDMRAELSHVRADPGRSIGTSTSPPPERTPSSASMPTFVTAGDLPAPSSRRMPTSSRRSPLPFARDEKSGDLDANMSLTSNPGAYDLVRPRRRWVLPVAVASTLLFVLTGVVALVLAVRTTTPPSAAVASTSTHDKRAVELPPPAPVAEPTDTAPSTEPAPPVVVASAASSAPRTVVTSASPNATQAPAARPSVKRPPAAPTSRKDLYRPF